MLVLSRSFSIRSNDWFYDKISYYLAPYSGHQVTYEKYSQLFNYCTHRSRQIDAGGSTFQLCGGLSEREMQAQVLDSMDIERERGITIKAQA